MNILGQSFSDGSVIIFACCSASELSAIVKSIFGRFEPARKHYETFGITAAGRHCSLETWPIVDQKMAGIMAGQLPMSATYYSLYYENLTLQTLDLFVAADDPLDVIKRNFSERTIERRIELAQQVKEWADVALATETDPVVRAKKVRQWAAVHAFGQHELPLTACVDNLMAEAVHGEPNYVLALIYMQVEVFLQCGLGAKSVEVRFSSTIFGILSHPLRTFTKISSMADSKRLPP